MASANDTEQAVPPGRTRSPWRDLVTTVIFLAALVGLAWWFLRPEPLPEGMSQEQYQLGARRFRELYGRSPTRVDVYSLLGEAAVLHGKIPQALACFAAVPSSSAKYGPSARFQEAQLLERIRRAADAERSFREFVALAEEDPAVSRDDLQKAFQWLVFMLSVELRLEDRAPLLARMHELGMAGVWESKLYFFPNLLILNSPEGSDRLALYREQDPENLDLNIAHARYLIMQGDLDEAQRLLDELRRQYASDIRCAAAVLELNFERADWSSLTAEMAAMPPATDNEPWLLTRLRGELALHEMRWDEAVRHFMYLLDLDPTNPWCHAGLARAYGALGRTADREEMLRRSLVLSRIRIDLLNANEEDAGANLVIASSCDELGLQPAAEAFRRHAERIQKQSPTTMVQP